MAMNVCVMCSDLHVLRSLIVLHMVTPCSEPATMHVSTEEMIIASAFFCKENEDAEDCIIVSCL